MKTIRSILICVVVLTTALTSAFAGLRIDFDAPVNVSHYVAGGGTAVAIDLLSRDYETGVVRFRLLDAEGNPLGSGAVFGVTVSPADANLTAVKAAILAAIPQ